ncbi:MAG: hypothetical protein ACRDCE_17225 [Cetobacterium sp.]|uniref:hypothetical protein n=1 Tax=Cetobacterium sp. TaxID=2071632 RepID=UPI003EE42B8E
MYITKDKRYKVANRILQRCNNKNSNRYSRYGGRGVLCLLGNTTREVYESLLKVDGYKDGLQIDRIDNDGHYEVSNLRWVTLKENVRNSSVCKDEKHFEDFAVTRTHFKKVCLRAGWDFESFNEIPKGMRATNRLFVYIKR